VQWKITALVMNFNQQRVVKSKLKPTKNMSFHRIIGPCLVYGQVFGMLPVNNVRLDDENKLEFRWFSFKTVYSMIFLFCGTAESCLGVLRLLRRGLSIQHFEALIFFILAVVRAFIFLNLAKNWKKIMVMWKKCESPFLTSPYRIKGWSLISRIRVTFVVLALLSFGNYF
jgi:Trehalose receptor